MDHLALFVLGLVLLAVGAPLLVFGAARLDRATGRTPFAVGLVAVCFGPCVAGLAFDLAMVLRTPPATKVAVGHIVGSTIASVGLVLGAAALARPITATAKLFHTLIPLAVAAPILLWFVARDAPDAPLSQVGGVVLLAACAGAVALLVRAARQEPQTVKAEFASWVPERTPVWVAVVLALGGIAALVGGARLTTAEVIGTAAHLKAPWFVLSSTLAAGVTALPTAVVAVVAARRGRSEIVLGLVAGSVLCNALVAAGASALARPLEIERRVILEMIPVMALFAVLLLATRFNGLKVRRWEGALLLAAYIGFTAWQVSIALQVARPAK